MELSITKSENSEVLKISGTLDIYAANALRDALADHHLQQQKAVMLDLSEVDGCDVTGVQLLCSARKSIEASSQSFGVAKVSQAVAETCQALGLPLERL